ncbi:carbon monoxide dehydrogenase subunit G [Pararhodobacter sp.]|uniref:CoxG family protein n=1 Tax=Pararhodobacter sp. TaxID=2127056 RepID=UPI002AFECC43|nr:carbon monoxide dehydrogenase subunit G [Pararhodobacter sp.]
MQMIDSRTIAAAPDVVWAALLNPEVLKACVPGCEELTGSPEDGFEAVVVQKVGPVKAKFAGGVTISDRVDGQSLTLNGEGKGGAAGFAKGAAHVTLAPATTEDGTAGTLLSYEVEAKVGGKLAQLGSRIIDGFARKMADDFFARFQDALEGPEDEDEAAETDSAETEGDAPKKGWFKRMLGKD